MKEAAENRNDAMDEAEAGANQETLPADDVGVSKKRPKAVILIGALWPLGLLPPMAFLTPQSLTGVQLIALALLCVLWGSVIAAKYCAGARWAWIASLIGGPFLAQVLLAPVTFLDGFAVIHVSQESVGQLVFAVLIAIYWCLLAKPVRVFFKR